MDATKRSFLCVDISIRIKREIDKKKKLSSQEVAILNGFQILTV